SDDDAVQYDGKGSNHPPDAARGDQRAALLVRYFPRGSRRRVRLALVSLCRRRGTRRSVQEISRRFGGAREGTTSHRRLCRRRSVSHLLAEKKRGFGNFAAGRLPGAKTAGRGFTAPVDPRTRPGNYGRRRKNGKKYHVRAGNGCGDC